MAAKAYLICFLIYIAYFPMYSAKLKAKHMKFVTNDAGSFEQLKKKKTLKAD